MISISKSDTEKKIVILNFAFCLNVNAENGAKTLNYQK